MAGYTYRGAYPETYVDPPEPVELEPVESLYEFRDAFTDDPPVEAPPERLTDRELEILGLVADDNTDKEVASELGLSAQSVQSHMKHIRRKLGVCTRAGAVARALRSGDLR